MPSQKRPMVGVRPTPAVTRPMTPAEQVAAKAAASRAAASPSAPLKTLTLSPGPDGRPVVPPDRNVEPRYPLRRPGGINQGRGITPQRPGEKLPGGGSVIIDPVIPPHWPIHLTASMLISPGASGQSPALQTLRAPVGRWLVIEEIKFEVVMRRSDNLDVASIAVNASGIGSIIATSLSRGHEEITNGYIPVAMFGEVRKQSAERIVVTDDGYVILVEEYSWRLPVPIIIDPGDVLVPSFEHRGLFNYKARVRVSYSGHLSKSKPVGYGMLPYVTAWSSPVIPLSGSEVEVLSSEKDLVNKSEQDTFRARYMLGRVYCQWQDATPTVTISEGAMDDASYLDLPLVLHQTSLKIATSWGNPVVPEYSPYAAVFDLVNRKLDMDHIVPPSGYFAVGVKSGGDNINNATASVLLSIVGQREVTP